MNIADYMDTSHQMYWEYKQLRKRQRQLIWKGRQKLLKGQ